MAGGIGSPLGGYRWTGISGACCERKGVTLTVCDGWGPRFAGLCGVLTMWLLLVIGCTQRSGSQQPAMRLQAPTAPVGSPPASSALASVPAAKRARYARSRASVPILMFHAIGSPPAGALYSRAVHVGVGVSQRPRCAGGPRVRGCHAGPGMGGLARPRQASREAGCARPSTTASQATHYALPLPLTEAGPACSSS